MDGDSGSTAARAVFLGGSRFSSPKAKRRFVYVHLNVFESGGSQPIGKGFRIDDHHRVENVQQPEARAVAAVTTGEYSAGAQHTSHFSQQPILKNRRWHVMQHRETNGPIEGG